MTLLPVREVIIESNDVTQDEYTLREAIEWFKHSYQTGKQTEDLSETELEFMNKQWGKVVATTEPDQELLPGPLGQYLSSVAIIELMIQISEEAVV